MQIRVRVRVRCSRVTWSAPAQGGEGAAARAAARTHCGRPAGGRSEGRARRAAYLHADAGGRGARGQPLHLQSSRPAVRRHDRDAVGHETNSRRRARPAARRAATACAAATSAAEQGRPAAVPPELVEHNRAEHAAGKCLGQIARDLNADAVRTAQGGRRWWPSTVRAVLLRSRALGSA